VDSAADGNARHVQRLGIHLAIDRQGEQFPELTGIHVGRGQNCFRSVLPRSRIIIMLRKNRNLPEGRRCSGAKQYCENHAEHTSPSEGQITNKNGAENPLGF
jgi:hypothetical protein